MIRIKSLWLKTAVDLRFYRQPGMWLILIIYGLLLFTILNGNPERPPVVYYYSELSMLPLCIMIAGVMCQREFSGGMEVLATYPVSLSWLTLRKWILSEGVVLLLQLGWMGVYLEKYHVIVTRVQFWGGGSSTVTSISPMALLMQIAPAPLFLTAFTVFAIMLTRRIYMGQLMAFMYWLFDSLYSGTVPSSWTLYTTFLSEQASFPVNRYILLAGTVLLLAVACWLSEKRTLWILREEEEE